MSTTIGRGVSTDTENDRTPLLGRAERGGGFNDRRARGDLPYWRHVLENRMTWEWYKIALTSAATSILLFSLPYQTRFVWILGAILYLVSSVIFVATLIAHLIRFAIRPSLLFSSIRGDESHHVPVLPAAFAVLIIDGAAYAEHMRNHNNHALRGFFWTFAALAVVFSIGSSLAAFAKNPERMLSRELTSQTILPLVLSGPVAAIAIAHMTPMGRHHGDAIAILVIGAALQGAGTLLSFMYLSNLIETYHKTTYAPGKDRPALFIASSLPAISVIGAFQLAHQALRHFPVTAGAVDVSGISFYYIGVTLGVFFWGLAVWWFIIAVAANLADMDVRGSRFGGWDAVFGHVALFLANNELLRVVGFPKMLTVLNEVLGIATVVVYLSVVSMGMVGMSGRFYRD